MKYHRWLITTLFLISIYTILIVALNYWEDWHGVRLSLFSQQMKNAKINNYSRALNQRIFNAEIVFRYPDKYDSFLFGSSRVGVIDVSRISKSRFYNMTYPKGLPSEHVAIIKAFLRHNIEIKNIVIALDEFCFNLSAEENKKELSAIMHPDVSGSDRASIFVMYFFKIPRLSKLESWWNETIRGKIKKKLILTNDGLNMSWHEKENIINATNKPIFQYKIKKYEPVRYRKKEMQESLGAIYELIELSRRHNISVTFFIAPINYKLYLNHAEAMMNVKKKLAELTSYYDFSGHNSVTIDDINYYELSHYRYLVGDMIMKRIYGVGNINVPQDFGRFVTKKNIDKHILNEKMKLEEYKARYLNG